jgi:hypothetical protein
MKAATFLYIAGGCFVIAAALEIFHKYDWESAVMAPAYIFLLCGVIALLHNYWTARQKQQ